MAFEFQDEETQASIGVEKLAFILYVCYTLYVN